MPRPRAPPGARKSHADFADDPPPPGMIRQELARGTRRKPDLFTSRPPATGDSAHAHDDDPAMVGRVALEPIKYNYRTPCFRDLQTQNAYLRGQLEKFTRGRDVEMTDLDWYKKQVHELTVHRAVLHKENEKLLEERKAFHAAVKKGDTPQARVMELVENEARLVVELKQARELIDALRTDVRRFSRETDSGSVQHKAMQGELRGAEMELLGLHARETGMRDELDANAHQLRQAHSLLQATREAHASVKSRLDELTAQHESMKSTFRSQSALSESLQEQLKRARDDARIATTAHEETALHYAQEKERHLGTQQQLAAAHFEVQQLQQKLEWVSQRLAAEQGAREKAETRVRGASDEMQQLNSRMALYSQWVGVGGQDAVKMRQWSKHDQRLRAHLHHERDQHDKAWFRFGDLQAGQVGPGQIGRV